MSNQKLDQLVDQVENYIECWKQFNNFVNLARAKKFSQEEDNQFLETKSVLIQELELILASVEVASPDARGHPRPDCRSAFAALLE